MTVTEINKKTEKLGLVIKGHKSAIVAFSGGVDSSFLAFTAHKLLGDSMIAVTVEAPGIPKRELKEATELARKLNIPHRITKIEFPSDSKFFENPTNRCYFCKTGIFSELKNTAANEGFDVIFEGSNADDASVYRPGLRAIKELGIISPLYEAGLTKNEIRILSSESGLPTADKPAYACLASRFPYGTLLNKEGFARVEKAEDFLFSLNFTGFRVRDHYPIARIELPDEMIVRFADNSLRIKIAQKFKSFGYKFVTLDIEGYRSGCFDPDKE
jgi:uncharacterized protein